MNDYEEIKKQALSDLKEREKRYIDWLMSLRVRHGNSKGLIEQLKDLR